MITVARPLLVIITSPSACVHHTMRGTPLRYVGAMIGSACSIGTGVRAARPGAAGMRYGYPSVNTNVVVRLATTAAGITKPHIVLEGNEDADRV